MISTLLKTGPARRIAGGLSILALFALSAQAQFVPGPGYYQDLGVLGSVTSAYQSATQQRAYSEYRQQTASSPRSAAWQNINRSMQADASARSAAVPDSGQAARDWMNQQNAARGPSRRPTTLPSTSMAAVAPQYVVDAEPAKPAPKEIMLWPTLLKDKRFDRERAAVEAPFRRASIDKKPLTVKDYEMISIVVEKMKVTVENMESQIVETEYDSVQKYLDDLIADAEKRIKARE